MPSCEGEWLLLCYKLFIIGVKYHNLELSAHFVVTVRTNGSLLGVNFSLLVSLKHSPRKETI